MSEATTQLIQAGILGPVLVVMIYYIWHITRVLNSVQEKRVADNRETVAAVMRMSDRWISVLSANTRALEANRKALEDLKSTLHSLSDGD